MASADGKTTKQWEGMEKARRHSAEQRAMILGTKHGTAQSKRGPRLRQNPEVHASSRAT